MRMMEGQQLLLKGLILITVCFQALCASDICSEEVARLREQEKRLWSQLQAQELLLQRLQLQTQPDNTDRVISDQSQQSQDAKYADCSQLFTSGSKSSGFYMIKPQGGPSAVKVYCDMSDGGGWIVIQRRISGAVRFNRSWAEYKEGFGDMDAALGELWLGNDNLHFITTQGFLFDMKLCKWVKTEEEGSSILTHHKVCTHGNYSLRINLEDFDGNQRYAEYKNFKVANEKDHYQLEFGAYVGTAGDALSANYQVGVSDWASHQGMKFSTYDRDNDNYKGNCAEEDKGGWWFNKCHSAHLNGNYYNSGHYSAKTDDGVVWYPWRGWWYSLKTSIMKLRPTNFRIDPVDDPNAVHLGPPS